MFDLYETEDTDILMARIRHQRNLELSATDWTQLADSSADQSAWAQYRQALRDLPSSNKDPKKIKFPTRPA